MTQGIGDPEPIVRALTALGLSPVFDPQHRDGGARSEDVPALAQSLIAAAEIQAGPEPVRGRDGPPSAWAHAVQDPKVAQALIYRRMERTVGDWQWATDEAPSPPGAAAEAAMYAAHALIAVHSADDPEHAGAAMDEAEEALWAAIVLVRGSRPEAA
ncbi:hypothetical protein [Nocardiopsis halotolerans]|uniref:hypothetical protein n=1 Tax=Nocardiopsis halotolerans TaxID=124252 RepID=UPI0003496444|nr:hypothetical protein [Nocardiopsis halotolerans]